MASGDPRRRTAGYKLVIRLLLQGACLLTLFPILYTLHEQPPTTTSRWTLELQPTSLSREQTLNSNAQQQLSNQRMRSPRIPLDELVQTNVETFCPPGLILVNDTKPSITSTSPRNIPRTIHMTTKTRCMPPEFVAVIQQWQQFEDHAFYLHNDAAMERLLQRDWPEFPNLYQVLQCTKGGAGRADVWRALVVWEYGGIYSDIDNAPAKFRASTSIQSEEDAYFVVERSAHLSQYFFAARPKHPLFYLLVQHMTSRLLALNDVDMQVVALVTGPGATRMAFCNFIHGQGPNFPKHEPTSKCWYPKAKLYRGIGNYTVRAVGTAEQSDEYVARDVIPDKNLIYHRMNMTYFRDLPKVETKESCIERIYQAERERFDDWASYHDAEVDAA